MDKSSRKTESRKELRFVTSAEQMIPFLNRLRETKAFNESDTSDTNDSMDFNEDTNSKPEPIVPPKISTVATSAIIAVPNIYEEYVNFIDLSVLNPVVDANDCQRDTLIESEISELRSITMSENLLLICNFNRNCLFRKDFKLTRAN